MTRTQKMFAIFGGVVAFAVVCSVAAWAVWLSQVDNLAPDSDVVIVPPDDNLVDITEEDL